MTLDTSEFIRRFLMHVLPSGFHRIRYYGFLTCQTRANNIERIRELLAVPLIEIRSAHKSFLPSGRLGCGRVFDPSMNAAFKKVWKIIGATNPGDFDLVVSRIVELAKEGVHDTEELSRGLSAASNRQSRIAWIGPRSGIVRPPKRPVLFSTRPRHVSLARLGPSHIANC
jgi:hypothetical protein